MCLVLDALRKGRLTTENPTAVAISTISTPKKNTIRKELSFVANLSHFLLPKWKTVESWFSWKYELLVKQNTQSPQPDQLTPTHRWKEKELHVNVFESKGKVNSCTSKILTFCYNIVNNSHTRSKLNEISQMINLQKQNNVISLKARFLSPLSSSGACHSCCSKWRQITK